MKISILTATYNRAQLLDKLYASILINSNNCPEVQLEWLVMDDGSTDNTRRIVEEYCKENLIDVKYFHQENQGKMTAINNLIKETTGDLIVECDSDDFFTKDAFKIIVQSLQECKDMGETYALVFLKYTKDGQNMGNNFIENDYPSTMFDLYFKNGITGEKALVYNASIRKQFEYKLEHDEKFVTEARLHHEMDLKYLSVSFFLVSISIIIGDDISSYKIFFSYFIPDFLANFSCPPPANINTSALTFISPINSLT